MSQETLSTETRQSIRRRRIISICSLLLFLAVFGAVAYFVGYPLLEQYQQDPAAFRSYIQSKGALGYLIMVGIISLQVVVAVIPGEPLEIAAGAIFGWLGGTAVCMLSFALSGALIFLAVRKWGIKLVEAFFSAEKINRFSFMRNGKKLNLLVFIMFLIPGTPKDILNYLAGLTPMKLFTFVLLTTLARIPSILSSTITGQLALDGNITAAVITYGITAVISIICIIWYRRVSKAEKLPGMEKEAETNE